MLVILLIPSLCSWNAHAFVPAPPRQLNGLTINQNCETLGEACDDGTVCESLEWLQAPENKQCKWAYNKFRGNCDDPIKSGEFKGMKCEPGLVCKSGTCLLGPGSMCDNPGEDIDKWGGEKKCPKGARCCLYRHECKDGVCVDPNQGSAGSDCSGSCGKDMTCSNGKCLCDDGKDCPCRQASDCASGVCGDRAGYHPYCFIKK